MDNFFLSALVDFPDDAISSYDEQSLDAMIKKLYELGVKRVHWQCYGNRAYGLLWDHSAPNSSDDYSKKTAENLPEMNRSFVQAAKRYGLETVAVMRPLETGIWRPYSPYYPYEGKPNGIPHIGGDIRIATPFLFENPEMRVKRRSFDVDPTAKDKTICSIKLYKQNDYPTNIIKESITIYTSGDNSNYKRYENDFGFEIGCESCKETVVVQKKFVTNYDEQILSKKDEPILTLTLDGLNITDRYAAVAVTRHEGDDPAGQFCNAPYYAIRCFDGDGNEICSTPGSTIYKWDNTNPLESGFNFDDGFGSTYFINLDPPGATGYLAICKGKNEYLPGTLCEYEPEVQNYWFSLLEDALNDDFDMYSNRIECHSAMTDEPYAYGYNDCIKKEYADRFGYCDEKDMNPQKIAEIRGDKFTELFIRGAKKVRERGKKVVAMLNLEMLHKPIPFPRQYAYPMNVEWQWKRWLDETQPDVINFRTYTYSPEFVLNDPQCMAIINAAKKYGVPMTYERYCYWDFPGDYKRLRDTGLFSSCILYETAEIFKSDQKGGVIVKKPEIYEAVMKLT